MVSVLSSVIAAGRVKLGQYDRVKEQLNQESCKQRGHCSWAWGLSGWGSSPGPGCASHSMLALLPLTWAVPSRAPAAWNHLRAAPSSSQGRTSHPLQTPAGRAGAAPRGCCSAPSARAPSILPWLLSCSFHPAWFTAADFCGALCSTPW